MYRSQARRSGKTEKRTWLGFPFERLGIRQPRKGRRSPNARGLRIEPLESRQLLSLGANLAHDLTCVSITGPNAEGSYYSSLTDSGSHYKLTDGDKASAIGNWSVNEAVGWVAKKTPIEMVFDLGSDRSISGVSLNVAKIGDMAWPRAIDVLVSADKSNYYDVGDAIRLSVETNDLPEAWPVESLVHEYKTTLDANDTGWNTFARYVKFVIVAPDRFYIDEVEIFEGDGNAHNPDASDLISSNSFSSYVESTAKLSMQVRRIVLDAQELSAEIEASNLDSNTKAGFQGDLDAAIAAAKSMTEPENEVLLPLNSIHRDVFNVQAAYWNALGISNSSICVWETDTAWDYLSPTQTPDASGASIDLTLMKNESRSAVLNISNPKDADVTVDLTVTDLPGGTNPSYVKVQYAQWLDTATGIASNLPLIDVELDGGAYSIDIPRGMTIQVWLTFTPTAAFVDTDGKVNLAVSGESAIQVPVSLRVSSLDSDDLPVLELSSLGNIRPSSVSSETYDSYCDLLQAHGMTTPWITARSVLLDPTFEAIDAWVEQWGNGDSNYKYIIWQVINDPYIYFVDTLGVPGTDAFEDNVSTWLKPYFEHLENKYGIDRSRIYFNLWDEPNTIEQFNLIQQWATAIHNVQNESANCAQIWLNTPGFPDEHPSDDYMTAWTNMCAEVDVIAPSTENFPERDNDTERDNYHDACMQAVNANDIPLEFTWHLSLAERLDPYYYYRLQAWLCAEYDATGEQYWNFAMPRTSNWRTTYTTIDAPDNYSPIFLDNDNNCTLGSKQLTAVYEGIEDYGYIMALKDRVPKEEGYEAAAEALLKSYFTEVLHIDSKQQEAINHECYYEWFQDGIQGEEKDYSSADTYRIEILSLLEDIAAQEYEDTTVVNNVTSASSNDIYTVGDVLSIQVEFSDDVVVTGTPLLQLNTGNYATYVSGSGTNTLTFRYTIQPGDSVADLDYAAVNALVLNGGSLDIWDNVDLSLPSPGTAGSLGYNKNISVSDTLYWDADADGTSATGGAGAWSADPNDAYWRIGRSTGKLHAWADGAKAVFGGSAGTVVLSESVSVGAIEFAVDGYSISSSQSEYTLTVESSGTAIEVLSGTATISSNIVGEGGINKTGSGELILAGANEYDDDTIISQGTLKLSGGTDRLPADTKVVVHGSAILNLNGNSQTVAGGLSFENSSGGVVQNGTLTLSGDGITAVESGTINTTLYITDSQTWNVGNDKTLSFNGTVNTYSNALTTSGTGTVCFAGAVISDYLEVGDGSTVTFSGSSSFDGTQTTQVNIGGTLNWNSSGTFLCDLLNLGIGENDPGTFTQTAGTVGTTGRIYATWEQNSVYNLAGGEFKLEGVTSVASGSQMNLSGHGTLIAAGGGIVFSSDLSWTIAGSNTILDLNEYTASIYGDISGDGDLVKRNGGILILRGNNTYAGDTIIRNGSIQVEVEDCLPTSTTVYLGYGGNSGGLRLGDGTTAVNQELAGIVRVSGSESRVIGGGETNAILTVRIGAGQSCEYTGQLGGGDLPNRDNLSLVKAGEGTLTISGANSYIGLTAVQQGTLRYGDDDAIASGDVEVSGGTLDIQSYTVTVGAVRLLGGSMIGTSGAALTGTSYTVESGTISVPLAGIACLTKTGGGEVTLSAANTFIGGTTISQGTLVLSKTSDCLHSSGDITINGGILDLGGTTQYVTSGDVVFLDGMVQNGTLSKSSGIFDVQGGTIIACLAGGAGLTKSGDGTITLNSTNSYAGNIIINDGKLEVGIANAIASGKHLAINGDGILDMKGHNVSVGVFSGSGTVTSSSTTGAATFTFGVGGFTSSFSGVIKEEEGACAVSVIKTGGGIVTLSGKNTYGGTTAILVGTLKLADNNNVLPATTVITLGHPSLTATLDLNGYDLEVAGLKVYGDSSADGIVGNSSTSHDAVLTINATGTVTFSGTIQDEIGNGDHKVALVKTGGGAFTLSGSNDFTGGTTVSDGTLRMLGTNAAGDITVSGDGILDLESTTLSVLDAHIQGGTVEDGTLNCSGTIYAESGVVSACLAGGAGLTKSGDGTITLNSTNSYTGNIIINDGKLEVGIANAIASGKHLAINGDGILDMKGHNVSVGIFSGSGTVTSSSTTDAATFTFGVGGFTSSFSGVIKEEEGACAVSVIKAGGGIVTLSGKNTYGGTTAILVGTLKLADNNVLPATTVITLGHPSLTATLDLNGYDLEVAGLKVYNYSSADGIVGNSSTSHDAVLTINATNNSTFSGTIQDELGDGDHKVALVKTGEGALTLSGTNTYTGTTAISQGTLSFSNANNLGGAESPITLGDASTSGILAYTGATTVFTRGITINDGGGELHCVSGVDLTFSNVIVGSGKLTVDVVEDGTIEISGDIPASNADPLVKNGAGTLTLSGSNTRTTEITGGVLMISGSGTYGAIEFAPQTSCSLIFDISSDLTYGNVISGTGDVTKCGAGTLTLTGASTYFGNTAIEQGKLVVTGGNHRLPADTKVTLGKDTTGGILELLSPGSTPQRQALSGLETSGSAENRVIGLGGVYAVLTLNIDDTCSYDGFLGGTDSNQLTLIKGGLGTLHLGKGNSYGGSTIIYSGTLVADENGAVKGINGLQIYGLDLGESIGVLDLNGHNITVNAFYGYGIVTSTIGTPTFTFGFDGNFGDFSGSIEGAISVVKTGGATVVLGGDNDYAGSTTVSAGYLVINGTLSSSSSATVTVNSSGTTLAGTGTINRPVSVVGGTVSPGGDDVGTLTVGYSGDGGISLNSSSTFRVDINGAATFDQLVVNGSVTLGGTLDLHGTYPLTSGSITIIVNNGAGSVTGTFKDLPDGDAVSVGGATCYIYYNRGDGNNDVIISSSQLLQAAGMGEGADAEALLKGADLAPIVEEAILWWQGNGIDEASLAKLYAVQFWVTDLAGTDLGLCSGNTIFLDRDAAGWGWFIDATPNQDEEYVGRGRQQKAITPEAVDRIDLLSVVTHELGHVLGFDDVHSNADIMGETLSAGIRRATHRHYDMALLASLDDPQREEVRRGRTLRGWH